VDLIGVGAAIALSLLMWVAVRARWASSPRLLKLGHAYLILLAYIVSCADHADYFWQGAHGLHGLPASAVVILTFPVLTGKLAEPPD
jgi:hypothetical protein